MSETIQVQPMTAMQRFALAQKTIASLKKEQEKWKKESELALSEVLEVATFSDDKFLIALGKRGESYREGNLKIQRTPRTIRTVLIEKFAAKFPDLLPKVCTIGLEKADGLMGKETMKDFVEEKTTYQYKVVDMELEA